MVRDPTDPVSGCRLDRSEVGAGVFDASASEPRKAAVFERITFRMWSLISLRAESSPGPDISEGGVSRIWRAIVSLLAVRALGGAALTLFSPLMLGSRSAEAAEQLADQRLDRVRASPRSGRTRSCCHRVRRLRTDRASRVVPRHEVASKTAAPRVVPARGFFATRHCHPRDRRAAACRHEGALSTTGARLQRLT